MYMDFQARVDLWGFDISEALDFEVFSPMLLGLSVELHYKQSDKLHDCEQHPFCQDAALASQTAPALPVIHCSQFHGDYNYDFPHMNNCSLPM